MLFAGAFTPQRDPTMPAQPPFQDYPITVPDLGPGNAVVFVSHASMVGVSNASRCVGDILLTADPHLGFVGEFWLLHGNR